MNAAAKEWSPQNNNTTAVGSGGTFSKQNIYIDAAIQKFEKISINDSAKNQSETHKKTNNAASRSTEQHKGKKQKQTNKGNKNSDKNRNKKSSDGKENHTKNNNNNNNSKTVNKKNQNSSHKKNSHKAKHKKNTESFEPDYSAPDCRIVVGLPTEKFNREYSVHDIVMVPQLVCDQNDFSLYKQLVEEIQSIGRDNLLVEWHGDTHLIANDKIMGGKWKEKMPAFNFIVNRMRTYFDMDIKATRFNWYRNSDDWKPYHHDAAAVKARFALTQNCTVAVSVGEERECGFQHAKTGTVVSCPQPNGCAYAFGRDVNLEWRHGVLPTKKKDCSGRISIIAWGYVKQTDNGTRQANHPFFNQNSNVGNDNKNNRNKKNTFKKNHGGKSKGGKGWFSK
jgi:hypothetical protein